MWGFHFSKDFWGGVIITIITGSIIFFLAIKSYDNKLLLIAQDINTINKSLNSISRTNNNLMGDVRASNIALNRKIQQQSEGIRKINSKVNLIHPEISRKIDGAISKVKPSDRKEVSWVIKKWMINRLGGYTSVARSIRAINPLYKNLTNEEIIIIVGVLGLLPKGAEHDKRYKWPQRK